MAATIATDDHRDAEGQAPAPPVDLGRQRAPRFQIQHDHTVGPGHADLLDRARRVARFAGLRRVRDGRRSDVIADVAEVLAQGPPARRRGGRSRPAIARVPAADAARRSPTSGHELRHRFAHVPFLELVDAGQPSRRPSRIDGATRSTTSRTNPPGIAPSSIARQRRLDGAAAVVAEDDDQRHVEHRHRELDRAQHGRVDGLPGGAHHEHVTQALVEDELGGDPAVGTAEHHRGRLLTGGQAGPVLDALAGMLRLAGRRIARYPL